MKLKQEAGNQHSEEIGNETESTRIRGFQEANQQRYELSTFSPDELKDNSIHKLFLKDHFLGSVDSEREKFYSQEAMYFGYYGTPVVTTSGIVLTGWEDVVAARTNKRESIQVKVAKDIHEDDVIRFVNFQLLFKNMEKTNRFLLLDAVDEYIKSPRGKEWVRSSTSYTVTTEILAFLTGVSAELVKRYLKIGRADIELFNDDKPLNELYELACRRTGGFELLIGKENEVSIKIGQRKDTYTIDQEWVFINGKEILKLISEDRSRLLTIIMEDKII